MKPKSSNKKKSKLNNELIQNDTAPVPSDLQSKANAFLNANDENPAALKRLVDSLQNAETDFIGPMCMLQVVFKNLLKRGSVHPTRKSQKKDKKMIKDTKWKYNKYYEQTWSLLLGRLGSADSTEASTALKVCMQLMHVEAQLDEIKCLPSERMRSILDAIIKAETAPASALTAFKTYAKYFDVLQLSYELLPELVPSSFKDTPKEALNLLNIINALPLHANVLGQYFCGPGTKNEKAKSSNFDLTRPHLNTLWEAILGASTDIDETVHQRMLFVMIERLPNLDNPIFLTDFLMQSLHMDDGILALLSIQGMFTLMQKHNITYPEVYTKLYNMFCPRILYNKYKARLFYLADIFLTSTHLPENLVAAFVKRFARLALKSPTEDTLIIIQFISNMLLRHTSLQRLICAPPSARGIELTDPYDENETDPVKSGALKSSLWEMVLLQKHAIPEVSKAACFVNKSLPMMETDLGPILDRTESELFDDEVNKPAKQFPMGFERPKNFAVPKHDVVSIYFNLF